MPASAPPSTPPPDHPHAVRPAAAATLVRLCPADEVWEGAIRGAELPGGHRLALYQYDGAFYATDDTCTHGAASLSEDGQVEGPYVECTWHNGRFDLRTGEPCAMPCSVPLKSWPVRIVDGQVCVELPADPAAGAHAAAESAAEDAAAAPSPPAATRPEPPAR